MESRQPEQPFLPGRRKALGQLGLTALGSLCPPAWLQGALLKDDSGTISHPHIFWRGEKRGSLKTIDAVRASITQPGLTAKIWQSIKDACEAELGTSPLTCRSEIPDRPSSASSSNNPDYTICRAAGHRILRHAIALHLTGREAHKRAALVQLEAVFDDSVWPDWIDQAHLRFNLPADLRTGMLSQDIGLAYDWLHPFLSGKEKSFIIEGLDRRGIQPFLQSMAADPWWSKDMNNWYTVIIGGLGMAGMALGKDHGKAEHLVDLSLPMMRKYLSIYGEDGSFNESVAYSGATRIPVAYFFAYYYHMAGGENPLTQHPFPETAEWTIHATLPPGRFAAFGDGHAEAPVEAAYMSAIAAATRNPVIQGYAIRHQGIHPNPYQLLWLDAGLEQSSPEGKLPLGKAFRDNSALFFSRSSWDPEEPEMIVYGKAKRAHNHGHNDLGQVCIDVRGQRMITDPGSPSSYPADFFDSARYEYYNASLRGHNVLMIGGREQNHPPQDRGVKEAINFNAYNGRILKAKFRDDKGGYWQVDLTPAYAGALRVRRTVVHLLPGWVAVLDEAVLENPETISLRWHTINAVEPDPDGSFTVVSGKACLAGRVESLSGSVVSLQLKQHAYEEPFNMDRSGTALESRKEPYIELVLNDRQCRILTLFTAFSHGQESSWARDGDTWSWESKDLRGLVICNDEMLTVRCTQNHSQRPLGQISVPLMPFES